MDRLDGYQRQEAYTVANYQAALPAEGVCLHQKLYKESLIRCLRKSRERQSPVRIRIGEFRAMEVE